MKGLLILLSLIIILTSCSIGQPTQSEKIYYQEKYFTIDTIPVYNEKGEIIKYKYIQIKYINSYKEKNGGVVHNPLEIVES